MSNPIPVILCGKAAHVATVFKAAIKPAYEVIHIIFSLEAGVAEIPVLLRGERPPSPAEGRHGTWNSSRRPAAVITGGGYNDAMFEEMRGACRGESRVPWLRPDMHALPPHGPGYGAAMAEKAKACLAQLAKEGKMNEDGVYFY